MTGPKISFSLSVYNIMGFIVPFFFIMPFYMHIFMLCSYSLAPIALPLPFFYFIGFLPSPSFILLVPFLLHSVKSFPDSLLCLALN